MLHRFVLQGKIATASNSVLTGTFPHWACSTHGFSPLGKVCVRHWCDASGPVGQESLSFKTQSALGWGFRAAPVLHTGHFLVTLISQSKSQERKREMNVLIWQWDASYLEKCVTKGLKLSRGGVWLTPKTCTVPLHSSSKGKIIYQHYLSSVCGLEGEELPRSKQVFGHIVFSQQKERHTHLTSPSLHHNLGHVDDISHHFYVLSFPALDGFRKDLQLKLFPLPQLLALWLESQQSFVSWRAGANPNHPSLTSNTHTALWALGWSCQGSWNPVLAPSQKVC